MKHRTSYLEIHEKAYVNLREGDKTSWSEQGDIEERVSFYLRACAREGLQIESSILVLGCGDGETSIALALAGYRVTGIDISPSAIRWAVEKANQRQARCNFVVGDFVSDRSSVGGSFDAIIDDHCLHCIVGSDRDTALRQVHSLLRSEGLFITRTQCGDPPADCSPEFLQTWDSASRCQAYKGIAGRYFGLPHLILDEIQAAGLSISGHRTFKYPTGWEMLEAMARSVK